MKYLQKSFTGPTTDVADEAWDRTFGKKASEEQPLPTAGKQSVTAALRALLDERERKGIATYGTSLTTFNGRSALRDAIEESLDQTQYLMQEVMEREALEAKLADALHILSSLEWSEWSWGEGACPCCRLAQRHEEDCALDALLHPEKL